MKIEKRFEGVEISEAVKVGEKTYTFGRGGLHAVDEPGVFESDHLFGIYDFDFGSFYPSVIINHGFAPLHLPKSAFLREYRGLRDKRLEAKRVRNKLMAKSLKIPLNALFGKTGSAYGWLSDPTALIKCTVTGELTLLLFIDLLDLCKNVQVVSANTDGITIMMRRDRAPEIIAHVDNLAKLLELSVDWMEYDRYIRRDVNNYLAVTSAVRDDEGIWHPIAEDDSSRIKTKGCFRYELDSLDRKSVNRIAIKAAQEFFVDGTPIADTVRGCRDVTMFTDYFRPTKSSWHLEDDSGNNLGHIVRWYLGTRSGSCGILAVNPSGKKTSKLERGGVLCNDLPAVFPDDVDFDRYIAIAQDLVDSVLNPPEKHETQIPIAELSHAQRDRLAICQADGEANISGCEALDLAWAHKMWNTRAKGSRYATAKSIVAGLWKRYNGALTKADLLWCMKQIDDEGYFSGQQRRTLTSMVGWTVRHISPFPMPQTTDEIVERACVWAVEHVAPLKRRRTMLHERVTHSTYVNGEALRHYGKTKDAYKLACRVAAVWVKHRDGAPNRDFIRGLIDDVEQYFSEPVFNEPVFSEPQERIPENEVL